MQTGLAADRLFVRWRNLWIVRTAHHAEVVFLPIGPTPNVNEGRGASLTEQMA